MKRVRSIRCTDDEFAQVQKYLYEEIRKYDPKDAKKWALEHRDLYKFITETNLTAKELHEAAILYKVLNK